MDIKNYPTQASVQPGTRAFPQDNVDRIADHQSVVPQPRKILYIGDIPRKVGYLALSDQLQVSNKRRIL